MLPLVVVVVVVLLLVHISPAHGGPIPISDLIPGGGVITTIVINTGISVLFIAAFLLCIRPLMLMYNNDKKRKMLERVQMEEREVRQCELADERPSDTTRRAKKKTLVGSVMRPWNGLRRYQLRSLLNPPMEATSWLREVVVSMTGK